MAEETKITIPKEVAEYLGTTTEHESLDAFKTSFDGDFIKRKAVTEDEDLQKAITGKRLGIIETEMKKAARELGIELEGEELKGIKVEGLHTLITSKLNDKLTGEVTTLKEQLENNDNEAVVKQLNEKVAGLEGKLTEERTAKKTVQEQYTAFQEESANKLKSNKIQFVSEQAFNEIKFKEGITDVEKIGFKSLFNTKFNLDLDPENGSVVVTDKEGKRIANPKQAGEHLNLGALLEQEANEQKLLKLNGNGGKPAPAFSANTPPANTQPANVQPKRTINTAARG